ncbi:DUF2798 domain-containing protein [Halomonas halocynthiae]|uniref:DUF2798 domain-containing protein n=1 Tax=Halomonas halocynthiae TaxID=176290 RepID=UPI000424ACC4|nr:DUF2798 domain-containing protein [Halomonas halocynthiae]
MARRILLSFFKRIAKKRGLPGRFTAIVFAFYMSSIMAFLMTLVITAATRGIGSGFFMTSIKAYSLSMPVAFVCVLIVRPLVMRLVRWTIADGEL